MNTFYSTKRAGFASLSPKSGGKAMQGGGLVYEGSQEDIQEDKKGAKKLGVGLRAYEKTAKDKQEDRKGQKRLAKKT
jgi:hypothetical protein